MISNSRRLETVSEEANGSHVAGHCKSSWPREMSVSTWNPIGQKLDLAKDIGGNSHTKQHEVLVTVP